MHISRENAGGGCRYGRSSGSGRSASGASVSESAIFSTRVVIFSRSDVWNAKVSAYAFVRVSEKSRNRRWAAAVISAVFSKEDAMSANGCMPDSLWPAAGDGVEGSAGFLGGKTGLGTSPPVFRTISGRVLTGSALSAETADLGIPAFGSLAPSSTTCMQVPSGVIAAIHARKGAPVSCCGQFCDRAGRRKPPVCRLSDSRFLKSG